MADRQLHVNITSTETVSSSIKAMNKEIDALIGVITVLQRVGTNASDITRASIQKQIESYQQQIAVVQQQIASYQREMEAIRLTTAALQERARAEAQVLLIETERNKLEASMGPTLERQILKAADAASTFAGSLSVAAAADSALRDAAIGANMALARQQELMGEAARRYALTGIKEAPAVTITEVGAQEAIDNLAQLKLALIDTQGTRETFEAAAREEAIATQTVLLSAETAWETALRGRNFAMTESINKTVELMQAEDAWAARMLGRGFGPGEEKQMFGPARPEGLATPEEGMVTRPGWLMTQVGTKAYIDSLLGVKQATLGVTEANSAFAPTQEEIIARTTTLMKAEDSWAKAMKDAKFASETLTASDERVVAVKTEDIARTIELMNAEDAWARSIKQVSFANTEWTQSQLMAESAMAKGLGGRTFADDTEAIAGGMGRVTKEGNALSGSMRHIVGFFDAIARGQFGQAMSSIASGVRDLGASTLALGSSLGVLVTVFATMAVFRKAEDMAKWAEETKAAAAASGMAVADFSRLQGAMSLVGVKADEADASLRALAQSTSIAIENSSSKQAEAFRNLGISQEQLIATGGDVSKVMNLLADAYVRTADGANKAANFSEILHRNWEKLIPALQGGSTELQNLKDRAEELGITLTDEMIAKLEQSGQAVKNLGDKIRGDGIKAMVAWSQTITDAANGLTILLNLMGKVAGVISKPIDWLHDATRDATAYAYALMHGITYEQALIELHKVGLRIGSDSPTAADLGEEAAQKQAAAVARGQRGLGQVPVPALTGVTSVEQMHAQISAAELAADKGAKTIQEQTERRLQAAIGILKQTLASGQLDPKDVLTVQDELNSKMMELDREKLSGSTRIANAAAKESYKEFADGEKAKLLEAQGDAKALAAIYDEWAREAVSTYHQQASEAMRIENEKTRVLIELAKKLAAEQQRARLQALEAAKTTAADIESTTAAIAQAQKTMAGPAMGGPQAQIDELYAAFQKIAAAGQLADAGFQRVADSADASTEDRIKANEDILTNDRETAQKLSELWKSMQQIADASIKPIVSMFDSLGSQLNTFGDDLFKALVAPQQVILKVGLESEKFNERGREIKQALGKFLMGVANDILQTMESIFSKLAAKLMASMLKQPAEMAAGGMGDFLGKYLGKALGLGAKMPEQAAASTALRTMTASATTAATALDHLTGAATASSGATHMNTASTAANTGVTHAGTAATAIHSVATNTSTGANIGNTVSTDVNTIATSANSSAQGGAGIIGFLLSILSIFAFPRGGVVPSAQRGMIMGGTGGILSVLHEKEMVLPAHISEGIQRGIQNNVFGDARSTTANLNYSPSISMGRGRSGTGLTRSEFNSMMNLHSGAMLGEARNMMRSGWRP